MACWTLLKLLFHTVSLKQGRRLLSVSMMIRAAKGLFFDADHRSVRYTDLFTSSSFTNSGVTFTQNLVR